LNWRLEFSDDDDIANLQIRANNKNLTLTVMLWIPKEIAKELAKCNFWREIPTKHLKYNFHWYDAEITLDEG